MLNHSVMIITLITIMRNNLLWGLFYNRKNITPKNLRQQSIICGANTGVQKQKHGQRAVFLKEKFSVYRYRHYCDLYGRSHAEYPSIPVTYPSAALRYPASM